MIRAKSSPKFTYEMTGEEIRKLSEENTAALDRAFEMASRGEADLLILDEVITAVANDVIAEEHLRHCVASFDSDCELVMTGRSPERWMIEAADYVTDMEKIRHPFDRGVEARRGIEF